MEGGQKTAAEARTTVTVDEREPDERLDEGAFSFGNAVDPDIGEVVELSDAVPEEAAPKRRSKKKAGKKKSTKKAKAEPQTADAQDTGKADSNGEKPAATSAKEDSTPHPLERDDAPPQDDASKETTSKSASKRASPNLKQPPYGSYAWMWAQSRPQESTAIRWTTIALGVSAALILSLPGLYIWKLVTPATLGVGDLRVVMQEQEEQEALQRKAWSDTLANAPATQIWDPTLAIQVVGAPHAVTSAPENGLRESNNKRNARRSVPTAVTATIPAPVAPPAPPSAFEELFGSADDYQKVTAVPSSKTAPASIPSASKKTDARGVAMSARLKNRIASDPAGAPAIAVLEKAVKLGNVTLPARTEIDGTVTGAGGEDTRLFVTFTLARLLKTSEAIALQGVALDTSGRMGIPGKKQLTAEAAKSLGLEGAIRALQHGAQAAGNAIGGPLGAAVSGVSDSAGNKAKRADRDEYVVISERGTQLTVYVQGAEAPTSN